MYHTKIIDRNSKETTFYQSTWLITETVRYIGNCNSALSMFIVGTILTDVPLRTIFSRDTVLFSVLRLGLLPAAVCGIDIREMLAGAAAMDARCKTDDVWRNPALLEAVLQYIAMQEMEADIALLNVTVKTLGVKPKRMLNNARKNFCTVTELANYLVRYDGVSFREAHEIIADVVANMCDRELTSADINREAINEVSRSLFNFETKLTDELVREALDPCRVVQEKKCIGGTAHEEVLRQIGLLREELAQDEKRLAERLEHTEKAARKLKEAVQQFVA